MVGIRYSPNAASNPYRGAWPQSRRAAASSTSAGQLSMIPCRLRSTAVGAHDPTFPHPVLVGYSEQREETMTTVTIQPADPSSPPSGYRAIADGKEATGTTVGQALDALTTQLPGEDISLVVIRPTKGDAYFSEIDRQRLADLMARWRAARDAGARLPAGEQAELDALADSELRAATARTAALHRANP